jgi:hypothetical protein
MTSLIFAQSTKRAPRRLHTPATHSKSFVPPNRKQAEEAKALVEKRMKEATIKELHSAAEESALVLLSIMTDLFPGSRRVASIIEW